LTGLTWHSPFRHFHNEYVNYNFQSQPFDQGFATAEQALGRYATPIVVTMGADEMEVRRRIAACGGLVFNLASGQKERA
jgi:hypothetical protein